MNPYESPQTTIAQNEPPLRLDRGVLSIAFVVAIVCLTSMIGLFVPSVRDFVTHRFGPLGLVLNIGLLAYIANWAKTPTRFGLLTISFMTCAIVVFNAYTLLQNGTVNVVGNTINDRVHSAWIWSVILYLLAGAYTAFAAMRTQGARSAPTAG